MHKKRRKFIIKLKRKRSERIKKLREVYRRTVSEEEKKRILKKALKVNSNLTPESFLKS